MATTPVKAWPYPLESDTPDVAADLHSLALALDVAPKSTVGTLAARPSSGMSAGDLHFVQGDATPSNNGVLWEHNGTVWVATNSPASRGVVNIAASESRTNTAYGTLTTPDQITGIVLPANGLIAVSYQATWQESVGGAARAAIFIGASQLRATTGSAGDINIQEAGTGTDAGVNDSLTSSPIGLISGKGQLHAGDVTTGQAVGVFGGTTTAFIGAVTITGLAGGVCYIFAAAGTYTVSVQFKASSGSVTALNRKLWVQTLSFA